MAQGTEDKIWVVISITVLIWEFLKGFFGHRTHWQYWVYQALPEVCML